MKYRFSETNRLAAGWLLLVITVIGLALIRGLSFDSSILALLPESERQPLVQRGSCGGVPNRMAYAPAAVGQPRSNCGEQGLRRQKRFKIL